MSYSLHKDVQGFRLKRLHRPIHLSKGEWRIIEEKEEEATVEVEALMRSAASLFQKIVELSSRYQEEFSIIADNIEEPGRLADYIAATLDLKPEDKQVLLETISSTGSVSPINRLTY